MNKIVPLLTIGLAWGLPDFAFAELPKPLLEVRFNGSGVIAEASSNSSIQQGLSLFDGTGSPADLHSEPGGGVSGNEADRALNLSASPQMGLDESSPEVKGGVARTESFADEMAGLKSFTVTMWFRGDGEAISSLARLIEIAPKVGRVAAFSMMATMGPGSLRYGLDIGAGSAGEGLLLFGNKYGLFKDPSKWTFVALTFSGDQQTVHCFKGDIDLPVQDISSQGVEQNQLFDAPGQICVGNLAKQNRSFRGSIDNVRIFGSSSDNSGALTLDQLEEIRNGDVTFSQADR
jgi:hypothetical protein